MERDWEIFGEDMCHGKISDPELHHRTLQAREDHIQAEVEIAANKLGL